MQNIQQITAAAEKQFAVKKSQNKGKQAIAHYVQKKEDSKSDTRPSLWIALPAFSNRAKGNDAIADCTAMQMTRKLNV